MAISAAERTVEMQRSIAGLRADHLAEAMTRGEALVIDVRESAERDGQDVIPGAAAAAWGTLEFWDVLTDAYYQTRSASNGCVVLHCASGARSAIAAATLRQMGYANVVHLAGGIAAWLAAGMPTHDRRSDVLSV